MSIDFPDENVDTEELQKAVDFERKNGECIVAYLDILGFKDIVNKYLNPKTVADKQSLGIIISAMEEAKRLISQDEQYRKIIKIKQFSDCVCLSIPNFKGSYPEPALVGSFMVIVKAYYFHFIRRNLYLRGGVAVGFHYDENDIIFSEGLIKAYNLESKKSIYPRIILDEELIKTLKRLWKYQKDVISDFGIEKLILVDWEGTSFINPFNLTQSMGKVMSEENLENPPVFGNNTLDMIFHNQIMENLENNINKYKFNDNQILTKYLWLKELLMWNIDPKT